MQCTHVGIDATVCREHAAQLGRVCAQGRHARVHARLDCAQHRWDHASAVLGRERQAKQRTQRGANINLSCTRPKCVLVLLFLLFIILCICFHGHSRCTSMSSAGISKDWTDKECGSVELGVCAAAVVARVRHAVVAAHDDERAVPGRVRGRDRVVDLAHERVVLALLRRHQRAVRPLQVPHVVHPKQVQNECVPVALLQLLLHMPCYVCIHSYCILFVFVHVFVLFVCVHVFACQKGGCIRMPKNKNKQ